MRFAQGGAYDNAGGIRRWRRKWVGRLLRRWVLLGLVGFRQERLSGKRRGGVTAVGGAVGGSDRPVMVAVVVAVVVRARGGGNHCFIHLIPLFLFPWRQLPLDGDDDDDSWSQ